MVYNNEIPIYPSQSLCRIAKFDLNRICDTDYNHLRAGPLLSIVSRPKPQVNSPSYV